MTRLAAGGQQFGPERLAAGGWWPASRAGFRLQFQVAPGAARRDSAPKPALGAGSGVLFHYICAWLGLFGRVFILAP